MIHVLKKNIIRQTCAVPGAKKTAVLPEGKQRFLQKAWERKKKGGIPSIAVQSAPRRILELARPLCNIHRRKISFYNREASRDPSFKYEHLVPSGHMFLSNSASAQYRGLRIR